MWIQNYFTLNLRFRKWYEFLSRKWYPFGQVSVSTFNLYTMMNFNHEDPRKKSPESAFIIFLLSALCICKNHATKDIRNILMWENDTCIKNLLNNTYFVRDVIYTKAKKRDKKWWTILLWTFFLEFLCVWLKFIN